MVTALFLTYLPLIATVLLTGCYAPQVYKSWKTKDVSGMSLLFWILLCLALGCMWANALVIFIKFHTFGYLITESLNLGLAIVVLIQVILYRKK